MRKIYAILVAALLASFAVPSWAQGVEKSGKLAPKPLFRDPVHDGAADPTLIYNRAKREWWMFYTNRRADLATDVPKDVTWVHRTRIGIAVSKDKGATWTYRGEAKIPYGKDDYTHWAPDIVYSKGKYHMFLTIVPGTFKDWNAPREIIHLQSPDLEKWKFISKLDVGSERIIDPSLYRMESGTWRIWYKDEADKSHIHYADSPDLVKWTPKGTAVSDRGSEAPKVFRWSGRYWLITDAWHGLGVYFSDDLERWTVQAQNLLEIPGTMPTDRSIGHHCDVIVNGDRAFIYYFTHLVNEDADPKLPHSSAHTVLQVAELQLRDGQLYAARDVQTLVDLGPN